MTLSRLVDLEAPAIGATPEPPRRPRSFSVPKREEPQTALLQPPNCAKGMAPDAAGRGLK